MAKGKVEFPTTPEEKVALLKLFSKKHAELGEESPLRHLANYNADSLAPTANEILDNHEKAEEMSRRSKAYYKTRNDKIGIIEPELRRAVAFLRILSDNDQHVLSDWGIDLVFSASTSPVTNDKNNP